MSSHEKRIWDTPDEENLALLMSRASELLIPDSHYSLELKLYGVASSQRLQNELEAQFDVHLDGRKGSELWFNLHPQTRKLILNKFSMDLASDCGSIKIDRTNVGYASPHEFIPSMESMGQTIEARGYAWNPEWQHGFLSRIVNEHGIDTELALESPAIYHMWLGHTVISKSQAWFLMEKREIGQQIDASKASRISIARRQNVPEDSLLSSETLSVIQESTDLETGITEKHRLDLISHQDDQRFARSSIRIDAYEKAKNQADFYGADAGDISHFTNIVEKVLSREA